MAWTFDKALERAGKRYDETEDLVVADVTKELDFDLIARKKPRRVTGTHFYVDVVNFNRQLRVEQDDDGEDLLRLLHIFSREVSRIVNLDFDGQKVHFQGPRLHALAYRPVADVSKIAAKALLTCLAIRHTTYDFNEVFALLDLARWKVAAGLDHGRCVATRNGATGDSELLFLGGAANHAAKLLQDKGIRMTSRVYDILPVDLQESCVKVDDGTFYVSLPVEDVEAMADRYGWTWTRESSRKRLDLAAEKFPKGCASSVRVVENIGKADLAFSNTKRVSGVSIFADVDGFTSYIDGLELLDGDLVEAVRIFHVLRGVMRDSAVQDFQAIRIQYQGDRMQALAYKPVPDPGKVALDSIWLAAALGTVSEKVIPEAISSAKINRLAIGLTWGQVLVSKIGEHGNTDVTSLGAKTADAASIQQRLDGGDIGIDGALRALLPDWLKSVFVWSASAKAYVAKDLYWEDMAILESADKDDKAQAVKLDQEALGHRRQVPARPWRKG